MRSVSETPVIEVSITDLEHTRTVARALAPLLVPGDVLLLTGELGAGKTTFTGELGAALGIREGVISPTFVLSRVHPSLTGGPDLVHVDAYRLSGPEELDDLDLEFSLDRSVTVIEWGRQKAEHLADSYLDIELVRPSGAGTGRDLYRGNGAEFDWEEVEEAEDGAGEPRLLRVQPVGRRWAEDAYRGLRAALGA